MNKILVIDDQKDNLTTIVAVFENVLPDCKVLTAISGAEGIKIVREELPDTILLDIIMPQMDGYEVCKRLKEDELTKHIPVVMVTAIKTDSESRVKALNLGADAFLSKPIDPVELCAQVNVMLRIKEAEEKLRKEKKDLEELVIARTTKLKESEEKLRLIIDNSPVGISTTDLEGHFIDVNPALCNITGYSRDEMINKHFNQLSHPDDAAKNNELFIMLVERKIPFFDLEKRYIHKNGNIVHILIRAQLIYDNNGKPLYQTAVVEDITERKRAEQIQKVLYNISNAVSKTDNLKKLIKLIQNELGIIIDTTNFYIALYDYKTDSLSLPFFVDERDSLTFLPAEKTLTKYVLDTKKPLLASKERLKELEKSGDIDKIETDSKIWLGVPLIIEGEVTGVLVVQSYTNENAFMHSNMKMLEFVSDQISISIHRKKAEDDLKTALWKATESDRLKSAFLATMSHELRTPLNAIIGFSEFLDTDLPPDDVKKFGEIINTSGNHLLSIVNDLFDITLIESGETKIRKEEVTLKTIFYDVYTVIEAQQQRDNKENIELNLMLSTEEENIIISTDVNKLKQILINLLKNAIKFTHKGFIHYGYEVVAEQNNLFLKFYVKDTGIGITSDKKNLIFDLFRQADDTNTRIYGGTGIGLCVAKRLTELLGGRIWLESEVGKGSVFYFTIPVEKPKNFDQPVSKEIGTKNDIKTKTVLIVEDDEASYKFIEVVLLRLKTNCIWVGNGEEAIRACKENTNINLVLMDINMPVLNGYEATIEIKTFNPNLPIIAQTAYAIAGDREKALEVGCDDYISKPIKKDELIEMIGKYI